jgi:hypothetical protein
MEFLNRVKDIVSEKIDDRDTGDLVFFIIVTMLAAPLVVALLFGLTKLAFEVSFILGAITVFFYICCLASLSYITYKWIMKH